MLPWPTWRHSSPFYWYFCFFIAYREPGSFCGEKRGNKSASEASRGRASSCSFSLSYVRNAIFRLQRRLWQSRGTGSSLHVIGTWSARDHYSARWRLKLFVVGNPPELPVSNAELTELVFVGVFYLHFFPGITMWVVSLMCHNLVSGLHYLVYVLVQNVSIKLMTRSAQNMHASSKVPEVRFSFYLMCFA